MKGYGGRVLLVDLTSGESRIQTLDERTARRYLGGNGLAAWLLAARPMRVVTIEPIVEWYDADDPWYINVVEYGAQAHTIALYSLSKGYGFADLESRRPMTPASTSLRGPRPCLARAALSRM